MKKIGIITINDPINYGNRLQNYAMQIFLEKLGYDVKTIPNRAYEEKYPIIILKLKRRVSRCLKRMFPKLWSLYKAKPNDVRQDKGEKEQQDLLGKRMENFCKFNSQYMKNHDYVIDSPEVPKKIVKEIAKVLDKTKLRKLFLEDVYKTIEAFNWKRNQQNERAIINKIASAFFKDSRVFSTTSSSITASIVPISLSSLNPPVSIMRTGFPLIKAVSSIGSRVTPGVGSVIALRLCKRRLNKVDFPTFGRPAITKRGKFLYSFSVSKINSSAESSCIFVEIDSCVWSFFFMTFL